MSGPVEEVGELPAGRSLFEKLFNYKNMPFADQEALFRWIKRGRKYGVFQSDQLDGNKELIFDGDGNIVTQTMICLSDEEHAWAGETVIVWLQELAGGGGALTRKELRSPVGYVLTSRAFKILKSAYDFFCLRKPNFNYWVPLELQVGIFAQSQIHHFFTLFPKDGIKIIFDNIRWKMEKIKSNRLDLTSEQLEALTGFITAVRLYEQQCLAMMSRKEVKAKLRTVYDGCDSNLSSARQLVDSLFSQNSRLVVLRVEFCFHRSGALGKTAKDALFYRKKFFNNLRFTELGKMLLGYVWTLEFTESTGYHFHLMLFLNGDHYQRDEYWGWKFVNAWRKCVDPHQAWGNNCNAVNYKDRHFLGVVAYHEKNKRKLLDDNLLYLCKKEQFVSIKEDPKVKTFGTSRIAREEVKSKGRPRARVSLTQNQIVSELNGSVDQPDHVSDRYLV